MPVSPEEAQINRTALGGDGVPDVSLPSMDVGGVLIMAYARDGRLQITIETDEVSPVICYADTPGRARLRVVIDGDAAYDSDN